MPPNLSPAGKLSPPLPDFGHDDPIAPDFGHDDPIAPSSDFAPVQPPRDENYGSVGSQVKGFGKSVMAGIAGQGGSIYKLGELAAKLNPAEWQAQLLNKYAGLNLPLPSESLRSLAEEGKRQEEEYQREALATGAGPIVRGLGAGAAILPTFILPGALLKAPAAAVKAVTAARAAEAAATGEAAIAAAKATQAAEAALLASRVTQASRAGAATAGATQTGSSMLEKEAEYFWKLKTENPDRPDEEIRREAQIRALAPSLAQGGIEAATSMMFKGAGADAGAITQAAREGFRKYLSSGATKKIAAAAGGEVVEELSAWAGQRAVDMLSTRPELSPFTATSSEERNQRWANLYEEAKTTAAVAAILGGGMTALTIPGQRREAEAIVERERAEAVRRGTLDLSNPDLGVPIVPNAPLEPGPGMGANVPNHVQSYALPSQGVIPSSAANNVPSHVQFGSDVAVFRRPNGADLRVALGGAPLASVQAAIFRSHPGAVFQGLFRDNESNRSFGPEQLTETGATLNSPTADPLTPGATAPTLPPSAGVGAGTITGRDEREGSAIPAERGASPRLTEAADTPFPRPPGGPVSTLPRPRRNADTAATGGSRPWDVLDEVEANLGGSLSLRSVREVDSHFQPTGALRKLFRADGTGLDRVHQLLTYGGPAYGLTSESSLDEVLNVLVDAANARRAWRKQEANEKRQLRQMEQEARGTKEEQRQSRVFDRDALQGRRPKALADTVETQRANELLVGDTFTVRNHKFEVEELILDADDNLVAVKVKDGPKFGVQQVGADELLHIDFDSLERAEPAGAASASENPFSRGTGTGITVAAAQARVNEITRGWKLPFGVVVVRSWRDLPDGARQGITEADGHTVEGRYVPGAGVYLVAENLAGTGRVVPVVLHELVGHFGLRRILGKRHREFMQDVWRSYQGTPEWQAVLRDYARDFKNGQTPTTEADRLLAASELVARLAENPTAQPVLWKRLVLAVRRWLREIGWRGDVTEGDIRSALRRAEQSLSAGQSPGLVDLGGGVRMTAGPQLVAIRPAPLSSITAHHGTPHQVDKFRTDKIGTGEGAQVYGWGLYFAENEKVAVRYQQEVKDWAQIASHNKRLSEISVEMDSIRWMGNKWDKGQEVRGSKLEAEYNQLLAEKLAVGNLYTVTLNVEPEDVLDWDKPLSEQSEKVRAAILNQPDADESQIAPEWRDQGSRADYSGMSGARIYNAFAGVPRGESQAFGERSGQFTASQKLAALGIKGIRYLDEGSRAPRLRDSAELRAALEEVDYLGFDTPAQALDAIRTHSDWKTRWDVQGTKLEEVVRRHQEVGTYNYVIFNEGDISITHQNGQPVAPALFSRTPAKELRDLRVPVSKDVFAFIGIPEGNVFADYAALAKKHPEYFPSSHAAREYVEYVFAAPTDVLPGNQKDHRLIVRRNGGNKAAVLEVELRGGKYRVRSAHTLTDAQVAAKSKAAGRSATSGVSRVNPKPETPSRLLDPSHGGSPSGIINQSASGSEVKPSPEVAAAHAAMTSPEAAAAALLSEASSPAQQQAAALKADASDRALDAGLAKPAPSRPSTSSGGKLYSNPIGDPEFWGHTLVSGARMLRDLGQWTTSQVRWTAAMVKRFGERIRRYLAATWSKIVRIENQQANGVGAVAQGHLNQIEVASGNTNVALEQHPAYDPATLTQGNPGLGVTLLPQSRQLAALGGEALLARKREMDVTGALQNASLQRQSDALWQQIVDAAAAAHPLAGWRLPAWILGGPRARAFKKRVLHIAARLNATGGAAGSFVFEDFTMRAGQMPLATARAGQLGVGDTFLHTDPLTGVTEELTLGPLITTPEGRVFHQLDRRVSAATQQELYNHFAQAYPELIWFLDMWIDPALAGMSATQNGIEVPVFNRFALAAMMADGDPNFSPLTAYTPDVLVTRSLLGSIRSALSFRAGTRSPGRKYKSGTSREGGHVRDLLSAFNIRTFQMLQENSRREWMRAVLAAATPIRNGLVPAGWVKVETGMEELWQAVQRLRHWQSPVDPATGTAVFPETAARLGDEGSPEWRAFFGEAARLRGRQLMLPQALVDQLTRRYRAQVEHGALYRLGAWAIRNSTQLFLVMPVTVVNNVLTNDLFTLEAATRRILSGLAGANGRDLRFARELFTAEAFKWFPGLRLLVDRQWRETMAAEVLPETLFADQTALADLKVRLDEDPLNYLREGELGSAALQFIRYGSIDTRAKTRMAYAWLRAQAVTNARAAGLRGAALRAEVDRYLAHPPVADVAQAVAISGFELLNYADSPAWLEDFASGRWGPVDASDYGRLLMPFPRFGYHFLAKNAQRAAAVTRLLARVPAAQRAEAFADFVTFLMWPAGGLGILAAYGLKGLGDDDDEARRRVGTASVKRLNASGDLEEKTLPRDLITSNRINLSAWARSLGLGTDREEDFWLRVRSYPVISMAGAALLAEEDGRKFGGLTGAETYLSAVKDLASDFFSLGFAAKVPAKVLNDLGNNRRDRTFLDPYAAGVPTLGYVTDQALDSFLPGSRQADTVVKWMDPVQRRRTASKELGFSPGVWDAARVGHLTGVLDRLVNGESGSTASTLPPEGKARRGVVLAPQEYSLLQRYAELGGFNVRPIDRSRYEAALTR